jgi:probable F420-dependent oxidoreductase
LPALSGRFAVRLGVVIANQVAWATGDRILRLAVAADEAGLHSVWVADHIVMPASFESPYPMGAIQGFDPKDQETFFEPIVTLAYVASCTRSVRLGTSIVLPTLRHPAHMAKMVATLDNLSGGRVVLGVGAGWLREEFDALAIEHFEDRGALLDEHIAVMRALWGNEVAEFAGRFYDVPPVRCAPHPAQPQGPPIWIGGASKSALRRVAAIADGWQPMVLTPDEITERAATLHRFALDGGRDPSTIDICARCDLAVGWTPEQTKPNGVYGEPELVAQRLREYERAGCTEMIFDLQPEDVLEGRLETLARLAEEVVPLLS